MDGRISFRCYLIGEESLLARCGEIWLEKGHSIAGVIAENPGLIEWSNEKGIPVVAFDNRLAERLDGEEFDYLFSIANLRLLPEALLQMPMRGAINFHDGLLPRYAGVNTPTWALWNQEKEYGITWHLMSAKADQGDILKQKRFSLEKGETAFSLNAKCFEAGIEGFAELTEELREGRVQATVQDASRIRYFLRMQKPEAVTTISWEWDAETISAAARSLDFGGYENPVGTAKLWINEEAWIAAAAQPLEVRSGEVPGTILEANAEGLRVATESKDIRFTRIFSLDGVEQPITEWAVQRRLVSGTRLKNLPPAKMQTVRKKISQLSSSEPKWVKEWESAQPFDLSFLSGAAVEETETALWPHDLPAWLRDRSADWNCEAGEILATALYALFCRMSKQEEGTLLWSEPELACWVKDHEELLAEHVPLRFRIGQEATFREIVQAVVPRLREIKNNKTYLRDLAFRYPTLQEKRSWMSGQGGVVLDLVEETDGWRPKTGAALAIAADAKGDRMLWRGPNEETARMLSQAFEALLRDGLENPDTPISRLTLLGEEERRKVLVEWNQTEAPLPVEALTHTEFEEQAEKTPDRIALVFGRESATYREINCQANRLARYLIMMGVKPDSLVGIHLPRSIDMVTAVLGVLKAGGAYVPLDPSMPEDRLRYIAEDAQMRYVITHRAYTRNLQGSGYLVLEIDEDRAMIFDGEAGHVETAAKPNNLAYVIYTSGTTGRPKGVMVEHRNVVNFFHGMDRIVKYEDGDRWLAVTNLSFDISVLELLWTLARGFSVTVHPGIHAEREGKRKSKKTPDFSLFYFSSAEEEKDRYRLLLEGAKFADRHGFKAVWTPERHFHPFGGLFPNAAVTSAALAAITERVAIRSGSVVLPLHDPIRVAEEWSVVDNLSNGRVGISFASGWHANDFVIRPEAYAQRKEMMVESIQTVQRLWRGESIRRVNPKGDEAEIRIYPTPVQSELPVWLTAAGNPETFREAGRNGANLLTHLLGQNLDDLKKKIELYREERKKAGLDPESGTVTLMLHSFVSEDEAYVRETVRQPLKEYLRSASHLVSQNAWAFPAIAKRVEASKDDIDAVVEDLTPEEFDALLEYSFERYYEKNGLFGTPESCRERVQELMDMGVDEIACLIDFGVPTEVVLNNLTYLDALQNEFRSETKAEENVSFAALMKEQSITHMQCTPTLMKILLAEESDRSALNRLRQVFLGGEALPLKLAQEVQNYTEAELWNLYGPTETTVWSSAHLVKKTAKSIRIGRPMVNTKLYVLDENREPTPPGMAGELYIGGAGVTRGYLRREELTREKYVKASSVAEERLYRTGDLVRYDSEGFLEYIGRTDHQIKIRGFRVELEEIERVIQENTDYRSAIAAAFTDSTGTLRLAAYVQGLANGEVEKIKTVLHSKLPTYMIPEFYIPIDRFPTNGNGKVNRRLLPPPSMGTNGSANGKMKKEPQTEIQKALRDMWREVLRSEEIGVDDNFFDLGGHSLLAIQLIAKIRQAFPVTLSMVYLFQHPTIEALAEMIQEKLIEQANVEDLESLVESIEQLSDEEVRAMLME